MTSRSLTQKGSAHVAIVITLVIVVLGALGFVFWKNFIDKKPIAKNDENSKTTDSKTTDTKSQPIDEYAGWKTYTSTRDGYSIKYPQTLSYKQESKKEVWEMEFDNLNLRNYPEDEEWSKKDAISISLMVRTMQNPGDLKSWLEKISTTELIGGTVGPSAVDFTNYKIGDINALDFHTGAERIYRNVAFYQNGNLYVFILNSTGETGSRYDYNKNAVSIFDQILSTFKFTK